ncbi:universal stress protein [bacterium]|nr:universal stress protein [bacterium]
MKQKSGNGLRVLWAVDILATDKKVRSASESMLKALSKQAKLKINPAYIVRFSEQAQPLARGEGKKVFLENVQSVMKKGLSRTPFDLEEPKAILQKGVYLRSDVDALVSEAKRIKADLILVNTHARKGFSRFWMGSFAETLMHHSPLPVLFLNPSMKPLTQIKTILFPVNLSPDSQKVLRRVGKWAAHLGAQLVLYNNVEYFVTSPELALTEMAVFTENLEKDVKDRKKTLEKWGAQLKRDLGIKVSSQVDESDARVSDGIIKLSKKLPSCVIAMASQTGPVLSVLVGSTTRRVVREATVPVLVVR